MRRHGGPDSRRALSGAEKMTSMVFSISIPLTMTPCYLARHVLGLARAIVCYRPQLTSTIRDRERKATLEYLNWRCLRRGSVTDIILASANGSNSAPIIGSLGTFVRSTYPARRIDSVVDFLAGGPCQLELARVEFPNPSVSHSALYPPTVLLRATEIDGGVRRISAWREHKSS